MLDEATYARPALGASGGQVPEAGAEVGAAKDGVGREGDDEDCYGEVGKHQASPSISGGVLARRRSMNSATAARPM